MSKRFKGKICVYCGTPDASETGDHVVARGFFPEAARQGLPIVPACRRCNELKSQLEHYLTAVLPFGASHAQASDVLSTMVPGRLANNQKLAATLALGKETRFVSRDGGVSWDAEMVLPFKGELLARLLQMIARGLAFWEWGVLLPDSECVVHADFLTSDGRLFFDKLFELDAKRTGRRDIGNGIFIYEGVQSLESPQLTLWRMSLCGALMSDDAKAPMERVSVAYALTAPRRMRAASEFVEILTGATQKVRAGQPGQRHSFCYAP